MKLNQQNSSTPPNEKSDLKRASPVRPVVLGNPSSNCLARASCQLGRLAYTVIFLGLFA